MSNELSKNNNDDAQSLIKNGDAFRFISPLERSKAYEQEENGETNKYVELYASSDSEDLVGDLMELSALEEMVENAPGTIMLRDHNPSVEKIFGHVVEAKLVPENGKNLLWIKCLVDDGDQQNIRQWNSIRKGVRLGASVTVIILEKKPNPARKNGLIITSVKLLEISIVTIPCNQDSWTMAATAAKALRIAEKSLQTVEFSQTVENITPELPATAENLIEKGNETMNTNEVTNEIETPGTEETVETAVTPAVKTFFTNTLAAMTAAKDLRERIDAGEKDIVFEPVSTKGMFNEILAQEPTLWDLFDILCTVKWRLMSEKWNLEYLGVTDFSQILTNWDEALDEFKVAAIASFKYWGEFGSDDTEIEKAVADAVALEKSFLDLSGMIEKSTDENVQKSLREIGASMLDVAAKAGIAFPETETAGAVEVSPEAVRKSPVFIEIEQRAVKAEADLIEVQKQLETAKAGLELATSIVKNMASQPLEIEKAQS